jgi:hypothetical protein
MLYALTLLSLLALHNAFKGEKSVSDDRNSSYSQLNTLNRNLPPRSRERRWRYQHRIDANVGKRCPKGSHPTLNATESDCFSSVWT